MQKQFALWFALLWMLQGCAAQPPVGFAAALREVTFFFEGRAASVCITGDFNQWTLDSHCLQPSAGDLWSIRLHLPPGPLHYAFVLNGKRWVLDPKALLVESDGFGRRNSVVMIE